VKLQRFKSRSVGAKDYHKWQVNLPTKAIEALGWGEGDDLAWEVRDGGLVIRKP
jgi:bifunctional DNA-binding transcriptional regulator/antitoxin component of YhaV-PrlF toxin-antitoxin module